MILAKDGKPFDIDNIKQLREGEVEIIQFLNPDGKRKRVACYVGELLVEKAKNLIISAVKNRQGLIELYVRKVGQPEEKDHLEFADNYLSKNSTVNVLKRMIEKYGD